MLSMLVTGLSLCIVLDQTLAEPKVVSFPFHTRKTNHTGLAKRDPFGASLENYIPGNQFFFTVSIGTPPQIIELLADTGSSDTWMYAPGACKSTKSLPCLGGSFDKSKSSSYQTVTNLGTFKSRYGDGSTVRGPYFTDNFKIGGETVHRMIMGLADSSSGVISSGIVGLGLASLEAITTFTHRRPYQNLPDKLVKEGLINSKSFSLYLDDLASQTGSVLFGGYDTSKFTGDLIMLPIQRSPTSGLRNTYTVSLVGFGFSVRGKTYVVQSSAAPYPVLLDSGTNHIKVPLELFKPFESLFRLRCTSDLSLCFVPCDIDSLRGEGTVDFLFGSTRGPTVAVPFSELAVPIYNRATGEQATSHGEKLCQFGISFSPTNEPYILGQPFLRSAYVMYDLDNLYVGLAQALYDKDSNANLKEYKSSGHMQGVTYDNSGPAAVQEQGAPQAAITVIPNIPKAFDVAQPTDSPPSKEATTLTPQVTPGSSKAPPSVAHFSPQTGLILAAMTICASFGALFVL